MQTLFLHHNIIVSASVFVFVSPPPQLLVICLVELYRACYAFANGSGVSLRVELFHMPMWPFKVKVRGSSLRSNFSKMLWMARNTKIKVRKNLTSRSKVKFWKMVRMARNAKQKSEKIWPRSQVIKVKFEVKVKFWKMLRMATNAKIKVQNNLTLRSSSS